MTREQEVFLRERRIEVGDVVKHYTRELDDYREFNNKGLYEIVGLGAKRDNDDSDYIVYKQLGGRDLKIETFDEFFSPVDKEKYPGLRQQYTFDKANTDVEIGIDIKEGDLIFTIGLTEFILGESSIDDILRLRLDIVKDDGGRQETFNISRDEGVDVYIVRCDGFTVNNFLALKVKNNIVVGLFYSFNPPVQVNHMRFVCGREQTWDKIGNMCEAKIEGLCIHYKVLGVPKRFSMEYDVHRLNNEFIGITVDLKM